MKKVQFKFWDLKNNKNYGGLSVIGSSKGIKKKDLSWQQAKSKYPKLNPLGDADRDGLINMLDCKPFDKKRKDLPNIGPSLGNSTNLVGSNQNLLALQQQRQAQQQMVTMQQVQNPNRIINPVNPNQANQ